MWFTNWTHAFFFQIITETAAQAMLHWTITRDPAWITGTAALTFWDTARAPAAAPALWRIRACTAQLLHNHNHCHSTYLRPCRTTILHICTIRVVAVVVVAEVPGCVAHPSITIMTWSNITWTTLAASTWPRQYHPQKLSAHRLLQRNYRLTGRRF
jgi:hypothetical protein